MHINRFWFAQTCHEVSKTETKELILHQRISFGLIKACKNPTRILARHTTTEAMIPFFKIEIDFFFK